MPKKIVKGVGMVQREFVQYAVTQDTGPEERKAYKEAMHRCMAQPVGDELREEHAQRCREILAMVGLGDMMNNTCAIDTQKLLEKGLSEDSAEWLAASWLRAFNRLQNERTRLEAGQGDVSLVVRYAEELGRLHERMFWRVGVDPNTGKRREKLAIGKQSQELSTGKAAEARREKASDKEPEWWDHARIRAKEIRQNRPDLSRSRIASLIAEEVQHSERQVRDVIKSFC